MVLCIIICRCKVGVGSEKASYAGTYLNILSIGDIYKHLGVAVLVAAGELTTLSIACAPVSAEVKVSAACDVDDNGRTVGNIIVYSKSRCAALECHKFINGKSEDVYITVAALESKSAVIISDIVAFVSAVYAYTAAESGHLLGSVSQVSESFFKVDLAVLTYSSFGVACIAVHILADFNACSLGVVEVHISADRNNSLTVAHINVSAAAVLVIITLDKYGVALCSIQQCIGISRLAVCERVNSNAVGALLCRNKLFLSFSIIFRSIFFGLLLKAFVSIFGNSLFGLLLIAFISIFISDGFRLFIIFSVSLIGSVISVLRAVPFISSLLFVICSGNIVSIVPVSLLVAVTVLTDFAAAITLICVRDGSACHTACEVKGFSGNTAALAVGCKNGQRKSKCTEGLENLAFFIICIHKIDLLFGVWK